MQTHQSAAARPGGNLLIDTFVAVRSQTARLAAPLTPEDCQVQSMPDASPTKWHLAHTTWFFETFVLSQCADYAAFHPRYAYLFNSYYESAGPRHPRPRRGLVTRPTLEEVKAYRQHVDQSVVERLRADRFSARQKELLVLGLEHEQQHQELIVTDIKHAFSENPLLPALLAEAPPPAAEPGPLTYSGFEEGLYWVGATAQGFSYDNEGPRHRVFLLPFELADRPVTNGEYLEFVLAGGYRRPEHWLSDGWAWVVERQREAPLYWRREGDRMREFTCGGLASLDHDAPVCHLSYFEADAYAAWVGARLPTEFEWEVAAAEAQRRGSRRGVALESGRLHPGSPQASSFGPLDSMLGDVWEWTVSAYLPYPGYRQPEGALGEYNGKFMNGQHVLRGGSCATAADHVRPSYRNFFPPGAQWQFSGVRLARDVPAA